MSRLSNLDLVHWHNGYVTVQVLSQVGADFVLVPFAIIAYALAVFAKYVVHPEHSEQNGVATHAFQTEEASDEDSS